MTSDRGNENTISQIGEFALIERLASIAAPSDARVGIGDDTAVIDLGGNDLLLATVDMLVENIHFRRDQEDASTIGRWALAVNVSDIAAMGGRPRHALVSLALPPDLPAIWVERLYGGLSAAAHAHGASVVGGNVARTDGPIVIDVALLGTAARDGLVLRSGARPGDHLAVTGTLGARAARRLLHQRHRRLPESDQTWLDERAVPTPRLEAGQRLAGAHAAQAMIDVSDGLSSDLTHLCDASGVGAVVDTERLPISPSVRRAAKELEIDPVELALDGGEDYELLVAVPTDQWAVAQEAAESSGLTDIGRIVGVEDGLSLIRGGTKAPLTPGGWRHL